jgi:hypothetical protein
LFFSGFVLIGPGDPGFLEGNFKANGIKEADQVFKGNTSEVNQLCLPVLSSFSLPPLFNLNSTSLLPRRRKSK